VRAAIGIASSCIREDGDIPHLVDITKRGDIICATSHYGAGSALPSLATRATPLGGWLRGLVQRMHGHSYDYRPVAQTDRIRSQGSVAGGRAIRLKPLNWLD